MLAEALVSAELDTRAGHDKKTEDNKMGLWSTVGGLLFGLGSFVVPDLALSDCSHSECAPATIYGPTSVYRKPRRIVGWFDGC